MADDPTPQGEQQPGPPVGAPVGLVGGDATDATPLADETPLRFDSAKELFTDNLFKDAKNSVLTLIFGGLLVYALFRAFTFVFLNVKVIDGVERSGWEVVRDQLIIYMLGPNFGGTGVSLPMVWVGIALIIAGAGLAFGLLSDPDAPPMRPRTRVAMIGAPGLGIGLILGMTATITPKLLTVGVVLVGAAAFQLGTRVPDDWRGRTGLLGLGLLALSFGVLTGFNPSNVNDFGGLLLTITVSVVCIAACFPIGIVMALARRSSFRLVRPIAVAYIELIRGVPLITLLFMGQFALGFLYPPGVDTPGSIPKAMIMITLFSGAYVAEIVRGGLQSVPRGQVEAGQAIGLAPLTVTRRIVLPQALRNSIPPLIGQFISLLKDTSLLVIISQRELLGVVGPILGGEAFRFQGFSQEAYAFVGFVYWIICFTMSRASQRLETRLGVGTR